ncbi:MAG: AAA family ATPase [Spirochaetales bacterium]|jgi:predicted ATP-dependent protease|nr:AAA family ATPase [Spirochaetales bacterium]
MNIRAYELNSADTEFGITDGEIAALEAEMENPQEPLPGIIGQERAVRALDFGIRMRSKGYNIYVTGLPGTGKRTAITKILHSRAEAHQADRGGLRDVAYVNNFRKPECPLVLYFEAGKGRAFQEALGCLVDNLRKELTGLDENGIRAAIGKKVETLRGDFPDPKTGEYLRSLEEDLALHFRLFTEDCPEDPLVEPPAFRYGVNLIVDNSPARTPPVIFENWPDYASLFGNQEPAGEGRSHFMLIRAGSLIRASGGFLVLRAEDIVNEEDAWNSLKRALEAGYAEIHALPNPFYPVPSGLKPEAILIDTKVIMVGNENTYDAFYNTDEDFPKLFKVHAEFDCVMERDTKGAREYIRFIRTLCADENLLPFEHSATAAIMEYGIRTAEFRSKLITRFSLIADLAREAAHWALRDSKTSVTRHEVERAIEERRFLYNLPECKIDEQILCGELIMPLKGKAAGRVNGLGIIDRGYYAFGRPLVITARTSAGQDGIINIEREAGLSGGIHDKGLLIIEGYLRTMYAGNFPVSIRASICFEQSYIEVDGDSASAAEIYALLSSIGGIPLRQDIAVTGSVNQMGEIQPVGGVSEKIEGFYEICRKTGLNGNQGVIIPRLNIPSLVLCAAVQKALRENLFHLYAVSTVDQGMEILTSLHAGKKNTKGAFPPSSVNGKVQRRLKEMALLVKDFGGN